MVDDKSGDAEFIERVQFAISNANMPKRQIASAIGISAQSMTNLEKKGYIAKARIPKFCEVCKVRVEWLLSGEGTPRGEANPPMTPENEKFNSLTLEQKRAVLAFLDQIDP